VRQVWVCALRCEQGLAVLAVPAGMVVDGGVRAGGYPPSESAALQKLFATLQPNVVAFQVSAASRGVCVVVCVS
jgi:hypothetical protein